MRRRGFLAALVAPLVVPWDSVEARVERIGRSISEAFIARYRMVTPKGTRLLRKNLEIWVPDPLPKAREAMNDMVITEIDYENRAITIEKLDRSSEPELKPTVYPGNALEVPDADD